MSFQRFWIDLQASLKPGDTIENWTAAKGYLGDEFEITAVSANGVEVDAPKAQNLQYVPKRDFEVTFDNWDAYCSGKLQRQELRDMTRFSKYTISIAKHLEGSLT